MSKVHPPRLITKFLQWFCKESLQESIMGDLEEQFDEDVEKQGSTIAKWRFAWNVVRFCRPGVVKSLGGNGRLNQYGMFQNYFKMTVRNAKREKAFTLLNIFCLAVGFTACLYVCLYSISEFEHDKFHEKADRIYRINQTFIWGERDELFGSTGPAVMDAVWSEVPEFETMCRIHPLENAPLVQAVTDQNKTIFEETLIRAVDSTFFNVFTFPLVKGNPETALDYPMSVILTEEMALKYFQSIDVLGKQMIIDDSEVKGTFQVTGVAKDLPQNSHVTFDMLISMSSIQRLNRHNDSWVWTTFVTFGVLRPDANPNFVADKVAQVPTKYLESFLMKYRGISYQEFLESGETWDLYIQPLLDIHLYSQDVYSRLNEISDIKSIYIMGTIVGLILLLSIINFVNLTTAKSSRRGKEVGVRKVLGSNRQNLMWQFMTESMLFCLSALSVSVLLLQFFLGQFNAVSGKEIYFSSLFNPLVLFIALVFTLFIGFLAGLYPAFYLSGFKPVKVLKSQIFLGAKASLVRNALVTVQFTVSIALIACALIVKNQVGFWLDMDFGFNHNNIIVVQNAERLGESMGSFKNEVRTLPSVTHASISSDTPPYIWDGDDFSIKGIEGQHGISLWSADEHFTDVYGLKLIAGRNYDPAKDHTVGVLVTRSLVENFDMGNPQDALGKTLYNDDIEAKILGVVEDFESEINWDQSPMAIFYNTTFDYRRNREISIQYRSDMNRDEVQQLLADTEEKWRAFNPEMPMKFYFLDQHFQNIFAPSIKFGRMIEFYSILAMIIAGLGLTGLVAYVIERKTKEIGIRKVLGASVSSILVLLSSEFGKLLAIGFVLASGLSWYLMSQWVQDFDNQAPMPWYVFVLSGLAMLTVTVLTIGYQTVRSAKMNPIDSLRDE